MIPSAVADSSPIKRWDVLLFLTPSPARARSARDAKGGLSDRYDFFPKISNGFNVLRTCFLTILHRLRAIAEKFFFECLFVRSSVRSSAPLGDHPLILPD